MKKRILSFVLALVMAVSLLPVSVLAAEDAPFTVLAPTGAAVEKTGRTEKVEWTWCEGEEYENPQTRFAEVDVWTVTVPENTQSLKLKLSDTTKYHLIETSLPSEDDIRMFVNMDYPEEAISGSWDSEAQAYQVDNLPVCTKGDAPITVWNNDYWGIPTLRIYVKFAPAEDENAPVVAGATLERITGSVYGPATNVYLAKLPADAAQFSVTLQSDEFVRAGSSVMAEARKYYVSQAYLDSTDWYNSLDAVMEDRRVHKGYKSVEEMLKINGYSSKEDFLKRSCRCETPAAFWDKTYKFVKCETTPLTRQTDNLAAMQAEFFNELFGSSSVKFDPTVEFRLLEIHTDSTLMKSRKSPGYGKANPRSVLLL